MSPAQEAVLRLLGPIDGDRVQGGCPDCRAYQTAQPTGEGVWSICVHHDDNCPVLAGQRAHG